MRSRVSRPTILLAVVGPALVVASVLWFRSDAQRLHRLVDDVRTERGVVSAVMLDDEGIREVLFTDRATASEIDEVWKRLEDAGVRQVTIGDVSVDPYDMDHNLEGVAAVALAVAEVAPGAAPVEVRDLGSDLWLSVGFGSVPTGADEPTPSDGAFEVLRLLELLDPDELPEGLGAVVAHRVGEQLDLVSVDRVALERLPETITQLRRIASTEPDAGIVCDDEGCHA